MAQWGTADRKAANTGTVAITDAAVTGTSSLFDAEVAVGDWMHITDTGAEGVVVAVASNTALTLDRAMTTVAANTFTLSEKPIYIRDDAKGPSANQVFGVDAAEVGVTQGAGHTGWVVAKAGTGDRAGRTQFEILVAGGITGDADDDSEFPDT